MFRNNLLHDYVPLSAAIGACGRTVSITILGWKGAGRVNAHVFGQLAQGSSVPIGGRRPPDILLR
ncbi:MAG: hypothetical protein J2P36_30980 [Ktedonobacteraceae bacterium]|nr:hypothetical protein [Ktedonobacteraceae bacterium]